MGETAALFLCFMLVMCVHLGRADSVDDLLEEALEGETNPTTTTPTPTPVSSSGSASIARKELKVMQNRVIKVLRDGARRDRQLKVELNEAHKAVVNRRSDPKFVMFAKEPVMQHWRKVMQRLNTSQREQLEALAQLRDKYLLYLRSYKRLPWKCTKQIPDCIAWVNSHIQNLSQNEALSRRNVSINMSTSGNSWYKILGLVGHSIAVLTFGIILALAAWWKVIRKVTASSVAALIILIIANVMRIALGALTIPQTLPLNVWTLSRVFERLSFLLELCVVFLLFWMWSGAAREMSRTEHSHWWLIIRVAGLVMISVGFIVDILSAVLLSEAFQNADIDGNAVYSAFITNSIVRLIFALGLLAFSLYVYFLARKASWGERVLPAFHRMLIALSLLTVSAILFCAQQVRTYTTAQSLTPARVVSDVFFFLAMCIAFVSFFVQMRQRVKSDDAWANSSLLQEESEGPAGLDMSHYDM